MTRSIEELTSRTHWMILGLEFQDCNLPEPDELIKAWSEPHRAYHNLTHLNQCLSLLIKNEYRAIHPTEIALALWFHDFVYNPPSKTNEEDSTYIASARLSEWGLVNDSVEYIADMILATKTHQSSDPDTQLLLDIDLSILGDSEIGFDIYEQEIALEYSMYPPAVYIPGRIKCLQGFLDRPQIYHVLTQFEAPARANLQRSIESLKRIQKANGY
jgi:predicted metal-dependent HD superfamily phosphohydrolase